MQILTQDAHLFEISSLEVHLNQLQTQVAHKFNQLETVQDSYHVSELLTSTTTLKTQEQIQTKQSNVGKTYIHRKKLNAKLHDAVTK